MTSWKRPVVLHVCTSCRAKGTPRDAAPGARLYVELRAAFREHPMSELVEVKAAECLSLCPRPCGIAMSSEGAWTYLFGDQQPGGTVQDIIDCVSTYASSSDGYMNRSSRPKALRAGILGRVPPVPTGHRS